MRGICVFCGSSDGARPEYVQAAERLGRSMAKDGYTLVYGGGSKGLMGALCRAVLSAGGNAIGIMPRALVDKEVPPQQLSDLRLVDTMQERMHLMQKSSDAFIALPGGLGTLAEFCEVLNASYLRLALKPVALLNTNGYYDSLISHIGIASREGFVDRAALPLVIERDPSRLLDALSDLVKQRPGM